jgi:hypothetical protein
MQSNCMNIYKKARLAAGIKSQQIAAEHLHISVRSLADYETGVTVPPEDVVCGMIKLYGNRWLGYQHLQEHSEIGRRYLPKIQETDLAVAVLRLQKEVRDIDNIQSAIVEVVCDGRVDHHERELWGSVEKEVSEVAGAAMALVFAGR